MEDLLLIQYTVFPPISLYRRPNDCPQLESKHLAVNKIDKQYCFVGLNTHICDYSLTSSAYVLPSVRETKFHTHTRNRQNYSSVYLDILFWGD